MVVLGRVVGESDVATLVLEHLDYEAEWAVLGLRGVPLELDFLPVRDHCCEYLVGLELVGQVHFGQLFGHPGISTLLLLLQLLLLCLDFLVLHLGIEVLVQILHELLLGSCSLARSSRMFCLCPAGADSDYEQDCQGLGGHHGHVGYYNRQQQGQWRWFRKLDRLCCTSSRAWNFFTRSFCSNCFRITSIFYSIPRILSFSRANQACFSRLAFFSAYSCNQSVCRWALDRSLLYAISFLSILSWCLQLSRSQSYFCLPRRWSRSMLSTLTAYSSLSLVIVPWSCAISCYLSERAACIFSYFSTLSRLKPMSSLYFCSRKRCSCSRPSSSSGLLIRCVDMDSSSFLFLSERALSLDSSLSRSIVLLQAIKIMKLGRYNNTPNSHTFLQGSTKLTPRSLNTSLAKNPQQIADLMKLPSLSLRKSLSSFSTERNTRSQLGVIQTKMQDLQAEVHNARMDANQTLNQIRVVKQELVDNTLNRNAQDIKTQLNGLRKLLSITKNSHQTRSEELRQNYIQMWNQTEELREMVFRLRMKLDKIEDTMGSKLQ